MNKKHDDKKEEITAETLERKDLKEEIDKEKDNTELENLENQLKRALADYQNLEKRIVSEKSDWIRFANKDLILRLMPGLDSLLLAQKHTQDQGVKVSIKHFLDTLEEVVIKKIETTWVVFDPNLMEAVSTTTGTENIVVEELRAGYTINGQILRPAQVMVGRGENN